LKRAQHFLHSTPAAVPLIVLVLSIIIFGIAIGGRFFSSYTLTLILQQIAIVGILGAAQTLVILTAGIDLSIGVIMVISAVIMGNCRGHLRHTDAARGAAGCWSAASAACSTVFSSPT
jgi:fructose transport system permease protein